MKRLTLFLFCCAVAWPQVSEKANSGYKTKEQRERVAANLSAADRDQRQKPKELVEEMQIAPGSTVADLGTGIGYMLPYLSKAVGPSGRVVAEDIFPDFIDKAKAHVKEKHLANVSFVLGNEKDPNLPADSVDIALVLDVYHHFGYPEQMLANIGKGLRKGGRLVVVDFYKATFRDPDHIRLESDDVVKEVEANGFKLLSKKDHTPGSQYIAIFEKK